MMMSLDAKVIVAALVLAGTMAVPAQAGMPSPPNYVAGAGVDLSAIPRGNGPDSIGRLLVADTAEKCANPFAEFNPESPCYKSPAMQLRPLAERGDADAQLALGVMFSTADGVPQNNVEALKWFRLSANQGNVNAQFNVGLSYLFSRGVPQDFLLAHMWFNLAAAGGVERAERMRGITAAQMSPEQIGEAQQLARDWKPTGKSWWP